MQNRIKNFAKLAIEVGINVQPGEDVLITSPIESPELARLMTEAAYEAGARNVSIDWIDYPISRMTYQYQDIETLSEVPDYQVEKTRYQIAEKRSNRISISAADPDMFAGLDEEKSQKQSVNVA